MKKMIILALLAVSPLGFGSNKADGIYSIGNVDCYKIHQSINAIKNGKRDIYRFDSTYINIEPPRIWNWVSGYLTAKSENKKLKPITVNQIVENIDSICQKDFGLTLKEASKLLMIKYTY